MVEEKTNKRMRMNVSITAKGKAQWDVTAEYDTPEETERNLREGIRLVREAVRAEGLEEVGVEAEKK
jgi:hypothetical protein